MPRTLIPSSFLALLLANAAHALQPEEVLVLANRNMAESKSVAEHYCYMRHVPRDNIVLLNLPKTEDISREDYDKRIVGPVRRALKDRKDKIKVLLCVYGVPLRVGGTQPDEEEKAKLATVTADLNKTKEETKQLEAQVKSFEAQIKVQQLSELTKELESSRTALREARKRQQDLEQQKRFLGHEETHAAVDSELMLLWWDKYELRRFLINPLYHQASDTYRKEHGPVLMTARLDGPTAAIAKRLVDDAVEVEKTGLKGKVYVDARNIGYDPKGDPGFGYGGYDESMREMARLLKDEAKMDVVLDNKPEVFTAGSCPDCALYCGWYSHANFVDSCKFVKGAVAWHLASSEAVSLRRKDTKYWCPNILLKGGCATLGPVAEPYTIGFPKPAEFFGYLVTGEYTLVECYSRTLYLTSWMCTLVGDPLYNPFKASPKLKSDQVKPSPKGGRFVLKDFDD
jgi:uncharacterized protein (TIGR03790 family)